MTHTDEIALGSFVDLAWELWLDIFKGIAIAVLSLSVFAMTLAWIPVSLILTGVSAGLREVKKWEPVRPGVFEMEEREEPR